ncbi:hypothetical protein JL722_10798 [Aureococcus anophagefferens]|nr:hypothetical protein JL722_10798 [Aureococcus anophagefferens]
MLWQTLAAVAVAVALPDSALESHGCALQINDVFEAASMRVEWPGDASDEAVADAAAAVVDELPLNARPAELEDEIRAAMWRTREDGCGASVAGCVFSDEGGCGRSWTSSLALRRRPAETVAGDVRPESTGRLEIDNVVVTARWTEIGRDLVVFASVYGGRTVSKRVSWASRDRRFGAALLAASYARSADVGARCGVDDASASASRRRQRQRQRQRRVSVSVGQRRPEADEGAPSCTSVCFGCGTRRICATSGRARRAAKRSRSRPGTTLASRALAGPRVAYSDDAVAAVPDGAHAEAQLALAVEAFGDRLRPKASVVVARTDVLWADPTFLLSSLRPSRDGVHARYDLYHYARGATFVRVFATALAFARRKTGTRGVLPFEAAVALASDFSTVRWWWLSLPAAAFERTPSTVAELKAALAARSDVVDATRAGAPAVADTYDAHASLLGQVLSGGRVPERGLAPAPRPRRGRTSLRGSRRGASRLAANRHAFNFGADDDARPSDVETPPPRAADAARRSDL